MAISDIGSIPRFKKRQIQCLEIESNLEFLQTSVHGCFRWLVGTTKVVELFWVEKISPYFSYFSWNVPLSSIIALSIRVKGKKYRKRLVTKFCRTEP